MARAQQLVQHFASFFCICADAKRHTQRAQEREEGKASFTLYKNEYKRTEINVDAVIVYSLQNGCHL